MAVEKGNIIVRSFNRLANLALAKKTVTNEGEVLNKKKDNRVKSLFSVNELKSLYKKFEERDQSYNGDITEFLKDTSASTVSVIKKNNNIAALIPEINSAKNVWVTSIMSPTDLQTNSLSFVLEDEDIDKDAKVEIEELYTKIFIKNLKLEDTVIKAIEDCLFGSGSYPLLVIPQQNLSMLKYSVDLKEMGRESLGSSHPFASTESFDASYKYLHKKHPNLDKRPILQQICEFNAEHKINHSLGTESIDLIRDVDYNVKITTCVAEDLGLSEDVTVAALESLKIAENVGTWFKKEAKDKLVVAYNPTIINAKKKTVEDVLDEMMDSLNFDKSEAVAAYKSMFHSELSNNQIDSTRKTVVMSDSQIDKDTVPIVTHIPSECVIPVGTSDEHIAYFVLVDGWGTPMSKVLMTGYDTKYSNSLIDLSVNAVYGPNGPGNDAGNTTKLNSLQKYNAAMTVFDVTMTKLLEEKLNDFGLSGMSIGRHQMIGRCIFQHLIQQKEVGLILVPRQLMTYYAVDYREDGTGKSLLENMEYVLSMRSTLLVSKILAMTRSAVEKTTIEVDMSKNANPLQTMRILQNAFFSKNKLELSNDLNTIVKNIYDSRVKFVPKNLKGAEEYSVQTSTEAPTTVRPDEELLQYFDKLVISGFQVPTSSIQETESTDYATSIVSKNLFFANVVRIKRDIIIGHTDKFVKTFSAYFSYVRSSVETILRKYYYVSEEPKQSELDTDITDESNKLTPIELPSTKDDKKDTSDDKGSDDVDTEVEESEEEPTDIEPEYKKEKPKDGKLKGDTIASSRTQLTEANLAKLCTRVMSNIRPSLPSPSLLKGKTQYEEITSYSEALSSYIDMIYNADFLVAIPEESKGYFNAMKAKIKADMLAIYMDKVGKQDLFKIPDIMKTDVRYFSQLNQMLISNNKLLSDEVRVFTAVPESEDGMGGSADPSSSGAEW